MDRHIYTDKSGRKYYVEDIEEDRDGYFIYDRYMNREVAIPDDVIDKLYGDRRGGSRTYSRRRETSSQYRPSPIKYNINDMHKNSIDKEGIKMTDTTIRKHDYESLPVFTPINTVNSNKGLYNTLIESKDMEPGTHVIALYPSTETKKYVEDMKKIQSYVDTLMIKPGETFEGSISEDSDKFISNLVNYSFKDIKMTYVQNNLKKLMNIVGVSDPGWENLSSKLSKAIDGKVETNLYILPDDFDIIIKLIKGTDEFTLPEEVKNKINIPYAGMLKIRDIIFNISYNKAKLFMVLP